MKKKAIEKIDYLKLPALSKKKKVKYIGVVAIKTVAEVKHLFLEVYRNKRGCKDVPVARVVVRENDFATYLPDKGTWSRGKVTSNDWYDGLIWEGEAGGRGKTYQNRREENILYSEKDLEKIKKFFKISKEQSWRDADWWEYIDSAQDRIAAEERNRRRNREYERRQQALNERGANTPELPEEKILGYADRYLFSNRHYLYYKKHGARATICCSSCGGVTDGRWKAGDSYESWAERHVDEPIAKHFGICPMCQTAGLYMPQGRMRSSFGITSHIFLGHKYKDKGVVMRYIEVSKEFQLEINAGDRGEEMTGAYEKLSGCEIARAYFYPGEKVQIDYHKHSPYSGQDFWDDCDLYGMAHISINEGLIMPETYEHFKGSCMEYSALNIYENSQRGAINPIKYMRAYMDFPQIEMLVKMGLHGVAEDIITGWCRNIDTSAKNPADFLGIRKEQLRMLIDKQGDKDIWRALRFERSFGQQWTREQIEAVAEINASEPELRYAVELIGIQKVLNWIEKWAGCKYGTNCSSAMHRLRSTATTYFDYLEMRRILGYDMSNGVYQHPRNLIQAHDKMVTERDKNKIDARLAEVAIKFPDIKNNYRSLRKRFFYEDDTYTIRPARKAEEIVAEGRILHHCVGGDNYLKKHNDGTSFILFLRFKEDPETPYITIEISNELKVMQWYGAHDKKPDEENMQRWIDAYVTRLKCSGSGAAMMEEDISVPLLALA